jgi:choline dehydrogenase
MTSEYDYIIVGAGSAGCVLANRLSENPNNSVLLIEAGGSDQRLWIKVPLGYAFTFTDERVNWRYFAAPDAGLNRRIAYWPRGRVLGGSSSINAMAYYRGLPHDFEDWAAAGATGWHWDNVKATFEALEQNIGPDGDVSGDGPVVVSDLRRRMHPFSKNFLNAALEMGWPLHGPDDADGLGYVRSNVKNSMRFSAADAFLKPARRRANLTVLKNAMVDKVLFDGRRANGVICNVAGKVVSLTAHREVILCAGAIGSPAILQRSGIGSAGLLKRHGVPVLHENASVGAGLQDHLAVVQYFNATQPTLNTALGSRWGQVKAGIQYFTTRRGPLSLPVNQVSGFVRSSTDVEFPDMQVYCNPASYSINASGKTAVDSEPGFLLCAQPARPTSRGQVEISSHDPMAAPTITPNSLTTDADQNSAIRAGRLIQKMADTPSIMAVTKSAKTPTFKDMDDAALLELFRETAGTVFHPCGTCAMSDDPQRSVLDSKLCVHGVTGLRVVDASAFPNITSGNTNAPTMMLALRVASLMLT